MVRRPIEPPAFRRLAMEQLSMWEYSSYLAARPFLRMLPKGDGHPVLVLPGFGASDRHTEALRTVLKSNGHAVRGWRMGNNAGAHPRVVERLHLRLSKLYERTERRVSIVGWSLGGIFARELARAHPDAVRSVITLGSPFRFRPGDRGHASALYESIGPREDPFLGAVDPEESRPPLPVPATSIYSRYDGIVRWHACIDTTGPTRENIEVRGTHNGLCYNIAATIAVADRLACPEGGWTPFRPPLALRQMFPRPVSWGQIRDEYRAAT